MRKDEEQWAIFWCDLLAPIIYSDVEPEEIHAYLKETAQREVVFPDGQVKKPSLSTLKRKLRKYQDGGFTALARKKREDHGGARGVPLEVIQKAVELKREQPRRSHKTINRFLEDIFGLTLPKSTLYFHLKNHHATRLKMGILGKKVRKRWTRDHTHDLWVGDFEEGPYVLEGDKVVPTHLSAFIDCHSRYAVSARYYFRQNMDVLIDTLVRGLSVHGAPLEIYLDNAKVYHSQGLRAASYKMNTRLIYRTKGDPSPGGVIERFIQTAQDQFEAEVRAGDILTLPQLNRSFAAWLAIAYHQEVHSETHQSPEARYQTGLRVSRQVDMKEIISSFMQSVTRRVNPTFADVQLNKRLYQVDPKFRGDKVEVRFDPFSSIDTVEIYSLRGEYLGTGMLHNRESGQPAFPPQTTGKPKYNYLELLVGQHQRKLEEETKGIDYRKVVTGRPWPFHEFVNTLARLLGMKGGLTAFTAMELETLKKVYNQSTSINYDLVKTAVAKAYQKSIPYIVHELKNLLKEIDSCF